MRRQECAVRVVGICGGVAGGTVAVVVLVAEVWTVPKAASWNTWAGATLPVGAMMGRLRTRGCVFVSVCCKVTPERGARSPAGEGRDAVAILVANEAEERAHVLAALCPLCMLALGGPSGSNCSGGSRFANDALCVRITSGSPVCGGAHKYSYCRWYALLLARSVNTQLALCGALDVTGRELVAEAAGDLWSKSADGAAMAGRLVGTVALTEARSMGRAVQRKPESRSGWLPTCSCCWLRCDLQNVSREHANFPAGDLRVTIVGYPVILFIELLPTIVIAQEMLEPFLYCVRLKRPTEIQAEDESAS
jgi:hypothetical protein